MVQRWKPVKTSPGNKFVGWVLADAHNHQTGQCNPSIVGICQLTGYSDRTVCNTLQELEKEGHLTIKRRPGGRSEYILHPVHPEPATPEESSPLPPKNLRPRNNFAPEEFSGHPRNNYGGTPEESSPDREVKGIEGKDPLPPGGSEPAGIPEPEPSLKPPGEVDYSENGNPRMIDRILAAYPSQAGRPFDARNALCRLAAEGAEMADILTKVQAHRAAWERLPQDRKQFIPRIHTYFEQAGYSLPPDAVPSPWVHIESPNSKPRPAGNFF